MKVLYFAWLSAIILLISASLCFAIPAFPGAEGFGADTPGGRGGGIIEVKNLSDSGPGSLRAACETEGARIVVFRIGGTIELKSHIKISKPYITIAGQTSPGSGIMLRNAGIKVRTHDVIIRCLRVRVGSSQNESAGSLDALNIGGDKTGIAYNVIVDRCSFSWSVDEVADSYSKAHDVTLQWCILSEGLRNSIHEKGGHSMGLLLGQGTTRTSIHHNLFAHNNSRNPRIKGGRRDIVNNVFYNWGSIAGMFTHDPEVNFTANYYKPGVDSAVGSMIIGDVMGTIYMQGNKYPGSYESDWELVGSNGKVVRASQRFAAPYVTTYSASTLLEKILPKVGCTAPARDSVDERIIREAREGKGKIIDSPDEVGGYPVLSGGKAPRDTDHDGMPDWWENTHNLSANDPSDAAQDRDSDGYTNVEEYVNSLVR